MPMKNRICICLFSAFLLVATSSCRQSNAALDDGIKTVQLNPGLVVRMPEGFDSSSLEDIFSIEEKDGQHVMRIKDTDGFDFSQVSIDTRGASHEYDDDGTWVITSNKGITVTVGNIGTDQGPDAPSGQGFHRAEFVPNPQ